MARLLHAAKSTGMVRIEISYPGAIDPVLSGELQDAFTLTHAVAVDTLEDQAGALRRSFGAGPHIAVDAEELRAIPDVSRSRTASRRHQRLSPPCAAAG